MGSENEPLIQKQQHNRTASGNRYYFLNKSDPSYQGVGSTRAVTDSDAGPVVEGPPIDSNPQEFAPRLLHRNDNNNASTKVKPGKVRYVQCWVHFFVAKRQPFVWPFSNPFIFSSLSLL
jgi:hypothetical protein